ncbi:MAG: isocitrate dehydrogenase, partial [Maribacter sp.]
DALDNATVSLLQNGKSPSRIVNELDNRGSHFYLALYWAKELSSQTADAELQAIFAPIAESLLSNEAKIVEELNAVQGEAMDIEGYYSPSPSKATESMRPSGTLNAIIDAI